MVAFPDWPSTPEQVGIVLALLLSLAAVRLLAGPLDWGRRLRARFVMGVPWGSLVTVVGVLSVYLFLQGGMHHWNRPLVVAYSAWSYLYPLGWLSASFAHAGPGHLAANLTATLVLAPLAEYAWGHYPRERGAHSFGSWRTNPWVRALVLFPLCVAAVGVLTSAFAWGPVVGFSGVVFAFAGFALVHYPIVTVVALAGRQAVGVVRSALSNPRVVGEAGASFSDPWWFGIAVQGHVLGLLIGAALGALLLWRRDERPDPVRLWLAAIVAGFSLTLWALWWYRGPSTYVLYRGLGVVFVFALALVLTVVPVATDRPVYGALYDGFTRRHAAVLLVLVPLVAMAGVAVPLNLTTAADGAPSGGVTVEDYTVTYAENVSNEMVSVVDAEAFDESTTVNASGVIVTSERRHIWTQSVSKSRLAFAGNATVVVGGPDWREEVRIQRRGWTATRGPTAYQVWVGTDGTALRQVFASGPARANLTVAHRSVSVVPEAGTFHLRVAENGTPVATAPLPGPNETVAAGDVTFTRQNETVVATHGGTRVVVAERERYGGR